MGVTVLLSHQVVGVVLLGYRKRLLYGISELRHAHPEWAGQNTFPGSSPKKKISPVSGLV